MDRKVSLNKDIASELTSALSDEELLRYSRQILLDGWDIDAQQRLKSSTVIIIGAGGLGCPVSETLTRAGIGSLHIIDDDVIELSNLQRQTLFMPKDVGKYKAEVAYQSLREINEFTAVSFSIQRIKDNNIKDELNAKIATNQSTLILDCTDNFEIRELLNMYSVASGIPLLSASAIGMSGQLALYEPYKNTGCYHCVFGTTLSAQDEESEQRNCANSGVLASTTTIMGNLQANAALQYLGLCKNVLKGELLLWDGRSMTQTKLRYNQVKNCPVCTF